MLREGLPAPRITLSPSLSMRQILQAIRSQAIEAVAVALLLVVQIMVCPPAEAELLPAIQDTFLEDQVLSALLPAHQVDALLQVASPKINHDWLSLPPAQVEGLLASHSQHRRHDKHQAQISNKQDLVLTPVELHQSSHLLH